MSCNFGLKSYLWFQIERALLVRFWNHAYDFSPNSTTRGSITIINYFTTTGDSHARLNFRRTTYNDFDKIFPFRMTGREVEFKSLTDGSFCVIWSERSRRSQASKASEENTFPNRGMLKYGRSTRIKLSKCREKAVILLETGFSWSAVWKCISSVIATWDSLK